MSAGWVAGSLRGRALARRAVGPEVAERVAREETLAAALQALSDSTYGHRLQQRMNLETAERAVAETALWHLRVLAGWLPPGGVEVVRAVAAWFEAADLEELAVAIATGVAPAFPARPLGSLVTVRGRAERATSLAGLRRVLAHSEWGDPGDDELAAILLGIRIGWARILLQAFPKHRGWGGGALAIAAANALFHSPAGFPAIDSKRVPELGGAWGDAEDIAGFAARLPATAAWALRELSDPRDLWRAERDWWLRVESDAAELLRRASSGRPAVVAAAVTLLADCWHVRTALARAARGPAPPEPTHAAA